MSTPAARLASEDFGPARGARPEFGRWLATTAVGWAAFIAFLLAISWVLLQLGRIPVVGSLIALILILVMVTATLLTMADRKWSALMQDRVGPNRARLPIPGLQDKPLVSKAHRKRRRQSAPSPVHAALSRSAGRPRP